MKLQAKEKKGKIVLVFTGLFFVLFFYNNALIVENSPQNIFDSIVHLQKIKHGFKSRTGWFCTTGFV